MHFPNEIVVLIIQSLGGQGLKSARLVSQTWCSYASIYLFKKIYIAPNELDLEVFNAITQHPVYSKCVRELVYDDAEFMPGLKKGDYIRNLWTQTKLMLNKGRSSTQGLDPQINEWVYDVAHTDFSLEEAIAKWEHRNFIYVGYMKYQEHSSYQQKSYLQGSDLSRNLVQGLSRLEFLEFVTLEGGWPVAVRTSSCEQRCGTPLARRWNPFHCQPYVQSWQQIEYYVEEISERTRPHKLINAALVEAQIHIKTHR